MARPVGNGAILEVIYNQFMDGHRLLNTFHYRLLTTTGVTVDGDAVTDILIAGINVGAGSVPVVTKAAFPDTWSLLDTRTQWIDPTRYAVASYATGNGPGTVATAAMPANVASTSTKRGIFANRHNVGSTHWGGMLTTDAVGGILVSGRAATMVKITDRMSQIVDVSAVSGALTLNPIIFNRTTPSASANWVESVVQETSRVMRRRTVGVGI